MEVSLNYVGHVWIANFGIATRKDWPKYTQMPNMS
jgi:hypothetical protein